MENKLITKRAVFQVLKDYWTQYKKHPWHTINAFFVPAIGSVLIFFVPPLLIAKIVDLIASGRAISLYAVKDYVLLFGGLWFLGEMLWRISMYSLIELDRLVMSSLGREAFRRLTERDYDFYINNFVGSLTKKASAFSRGFEMLTDILSLSLIPNIVPIFFAVVILWRYSPWIPGILLVALVIGVSIAIPIIRKRSKLVAVRQEAGSRISGRISDTMTNILAIKSFAREKAERDSFQEYTEDYSKKYARASHFNNMRLEVILSPIYVAANVFGLLAAIFFTEKLGLPAGATVVIFSYYANVTRIFFDINRIYRNIESALSEAAEFTELTIDPPAVLDAPHAQTLKLSSAQIRFADVGFSYKSERDNDYLFLNNFNLDIKAKERVGLVGPSGGGKTTITKLLLRFIDVQSGAVTIDDQDISKITQASLRESIGYVPQESLLFHRSLFENIAYGSERATLDDVIHAAKLARAHEFIQELPMGYDTMVGERGVKLSGGQRQRVAIARAILKNAPILVLDEATSSLDSESEKYIQEGLWELMKDKTALVIAHRLSTIKHLDRIIVLEQGKIVEDGTHDELIKQKGLYARLWSHQSGEFLED